MANIYCVPNEFDYRTNSFSFNFDTWSSVESFEAGDAPIARLRKSFEIKGDELAAVKQQNAQLFTAIENIALDLLRVSGRNYKIERIFLTAIGKFTLMQASSPDGEHRPDDKFYGAAHDAVIADNVAIIAQITALMIAYGRAHDELLAQMTASSNLQNLLS